ncbi:MAG: VTT domain-containing protein, partial [Oscillospiraceae bacterium]
WGILAFLGLQLLQIIVAVIPGEPIELMAGALYGTVWGLIVCLFGVFVGSVIIYYVVKLLGAKSVDPQVLHKYRFLKDKRHIETILFLLFFIPGTPKDMLCYLGPFLPVKPMAFFLISTFARIPSIMTSTYGGANLANGRLLNAVVMFLITGAVALVGILTQDKLINWFNQRRKNFKERHSH